MHCSCYNWKKKLSLKQNYITHSNYLNNKDDDFDYKFDK